MSIKVKLVSSLLLIMHFSITQRTCHSKDEEHKNMQLEKQNKEETESF